jgi:hypothetical protein
MRDDTTDGFLYLTRLLRPGKSILDEMLKYYHYTPVPETPTWIGVDWGFDESALIYEQAINQLKRRGVYRSRGKIKSVGNVVHVHFRE